VYHHIVGCVFLAPCPAFTLLDLPPNLVRCRVEWGSTGSSLRDITAKALWSTEKLRGVTRRSCDSTASCLVFLRCTSFGRSRLLHLHLRIPPRLKNTLIHICHECIVKAYSLSNTISPCRTPKHPHPPNTPLHPTHRAHPLIRSTQTLHKSRTAEEAQPATILALLLPMLTRTPRIQAQAVQVLPHQAPPVNIRHTMTTSLRWCIGMREVAWEEKHGPAKVDGVRVNSFKHIRVTSDADITEQGGYAASDYQGQPGYMHSRASTPTYTEGSREGHRVREPYPAWTQEANIPLSKEEIEDVLIDLANKFGFQKGSCSALVEIRYLL
jgi:hypothetical protein